MTFATLPLRRVVLDACDGPFGSSLKSDHYSESGARVIRLGNIGNGLWVDADVAYLPLDYWATLSRHHAVEGDLLVAGLGDEGQAVGRACVLPDVGPAMVKADCYRMRVDTGKADPRFMARYLSSAVGQAEALRRADGATRARLTLGKALSIPVPELSVDRQRAIADYLDSETGHMDAIIGRRSRQRQLLDEREIGVLSVGLVPSGVPMARLGFKATVQTGLTVDAQRDPGPDSVSRPYLRVANVQPGWLELESVTDITVPRSLAERCTLRIGDVLMTEGGDLDKLGRGTMWRGELAGALHQNHVFAVRPDDAHLDAEYLALLTRTAHARAYFEKTGTRTTNLASTNAEKILALPVPDIEIARQKHLVRQLNEQLAGIRELRAAIDRQAECLVERRQSLITAAVTGRLAIPGVAA